jgi:hypothetical protein
MVRRRGRLWEGLDAVELVTRPMRGGHVRGFASQLLSSIEARGGDRGIWLKLPRISLARSSQLRRGYQESLAGRDRILDKRTEYVWRASTERHKAEVVGLLKRRKKRKERAIESRDFYTPRKRRLVRARALPDIVGRGFLMQACCLVVYLISRLI